MTNKDSTFMTNRDSTSSERPFISSRTSSLFADCVEHKDERSSVIARDLGQVPDLARPAVGSADRNPGPVTDLSYGTAAFIGRAAKVSRRRARHSTWTSAAGYLYQWRAGFFATLGITSQGNFSTS